MIDMATDNRCPTENDAHNAMTLGQYAKKIGFHGHLQAIGEKYGSTDPQADWSKFVLNLEGTANIRITRWPTIFRRFLKGEYDADTPRMRFKKVPTQDYLFERRKASTEKWNRDADRRNAELDAEKNPT